MTPFQHEKEQDYLVLDLSGVLYTVCHETVSLFPDGLLKSLWDCMTNREKELPDGFRRTKQWNRFYAQRCPQMFDTVLQCYVSGKLHVPNWMCQKTVSDEITFWNIGAEFACVCCSDSNDDGVDEYASVEDNDDDYRKTKWQKIKHAMWIFFSDPKSGFGALVFAVVVMAFVIIAIINLVIGSIPELHLCPENATQVFTTEDIEQLKESLETDLSDYNNTDIKSNITIPYKPEGVMRFFSNCLGMQKFEMVDMICVVWFTLEITLRFIACPKKLDFVMSPLNIIDVMASFPMYVEILLWIFEVNPKTISHSLMRLFQILRTVTVLRILKLARYSKDLRILGRTIQSAKNELGMLCLFVAVTTLIFSSVVFQLEKEMPDTLYKSIPHSMWWAIATLTTVGYGDITPKSLWGKLAGSLACITGIMIVALPVSVLVEHFTSAYKKRSKFMLSRNQNIMK